MADQHLTLQLRPDVQWTGYHRQGRWVARDPLNASFFYFSEVEYTAAKLLDGTRTLPTLVEELKRKFPSISIHQDWIKLFITRLNSAHLLQPNSIRAANWLVKSQERSRNQSWLQVLLSPLSLRLPLFDPTSWLVKLRFLAVAVFHPAVIVGWCMAAMAVSFFVWLRVLSNPQIVQLDPGTLAGDRWLMLLVTYLVVKSLHEFGHALACVKAGSQCSEIGLLFLFFTPCLYCDTTDSWKLESKWSRAGIASAGIFTELVLATLAAIVWMVTRDGALHSIAWSTMVVCSIGTIVVNANPCLKYDGYYILSDLWGVPNLTQQAHAAVSKVFHWLMTGQPYTTEDLDANIFLLCAYSVCSFVYRTIVLSLIVWLLWSTLVPQGLGILAVIILAGTAIGLLTSWLHLGRSLYRELLGTHSVKFTRLVMLFTFVLVVVAFVWEFALPTNVQARAVTDFEDKTPVFAAQTGELVSCAKPNELLTVGAELLRLKASDKELALLVLQGEIAVVEQRLEQLKLRSASDPLASFSIPTTTELLSELNSKELLLQRELDSLVQRAVTEGYLIPADETLVAPFAAPRDDRPEPMLVDVVNRHSWLQRGTLVGWFSSQKKLQLTALVPEHEVKLLSLGQKCVCMWDSSVAERLAGEIVRISPEPVSETPKELVGDASLVSVRDELGRLRPELPHYEVTISVSASASQHIKGSLATVRIQIASRTLWQSAMRWVKMSLKPVY